MAHAAPTTGASGATGGRTTTPDFFSARVHSTAKWAVPVVLGLVYGYWAAANRRGGGPITGWNVLFGFVTAIAFAVLMTGALMLRPYLKRELHAILWFAFTGITFGFVYSQTGATVLRSMVMALATAAVVGVSLFYWYYTHEDAAGHHT